MQLVHMQCCSFSALCPDDSSKIMLCSEGLSFVPVLKNLTLPWKRAIFSQYPRYLIWIACQNVILLCLHLIILPTNLAAQSPIILSLNLQTIRHSTGKQRPANFIRDQNYGILNANQSTVSLHRVGSIWPKNTDGQLVKRARKRTVSWSKWRQEWSRFSWVFQACRGVVKSA